MASSKEAGRRRSVIDSGRRRSVGSGAANQTVDIYGRRIKKVQYENTYRTEPKMLFPAKKATAIIKDVVDSRLTGKQYDPDKCMSLCKSLANDIKEHIKELAIDRYKYVTVVNVGPTANTELIVASRCLLNPEYDTFASYTFNEHGLFAVAVVYAIYRE